MARGRTGSQAKVNPSRASFASSWNGRAELVQAPTPALCGGKGMSMAPVAQALLPFTRKVSGETT
jgi:hypothetical protein